MLKTYCPTPLRAPQAFSVKSSLITLAACFALLCMSGCTPTLQQKADRTYLSLKESIIESTRGKQVKSIPIPSDALAAKPASLDELLHKVGKLAAQDNRAVEITSVAGDRNYLRQGVASGARESGRPVRITMLSTDSRANTLIVLK